MQNSLSILALKFQEQRELDPNVCLDIDKLFGPGTPCLFARLEDLIAEVGLQVPLNKTSNYRIIILLGAEGEKKLGNKNYKMVSPSATIIPPGLPNASTYTGENPKGYILCLDPQTFSNAPFPRYFDNNKHILQPETPVIPLDQGATSQLVACMEELLAEELENAPLKAEMMAARLSELMIIIERQYRKAFAPANIWQRDLVTNFKKLVSEKFREEHQVKYYARQLHVHPNYLNSIIKLETGRTPKHYIERMIAHEAETLFMNTSIQIKDIAYDLGFSSPNYFIRFTFRVLGKSPGELRLQNR